MERSLKLKGLGPRPDRGPQDGYEGRSGRKQWPKRTDGGCMAANGDECSIVAGVICLLCSMAENQTSIAAYAQNPAVETQQTDTRYQPSLCYPLSPTIQFFFVPARISYSNSCSYLPFSAVPFVRSKSQRRVNVPINQNPVILDSLKCLKPPTCSGHFSTMTKPLVRGA